MSLQTVQMNHDQLKDLLDVYAGDAENGNRHDFARALWDLRDHVDDLPVGYGFFSVVDFDAFDDDRFVRVELVSYE